MSQKLTFYPLGNAESCKLELTNGKKILFDYANMYSGEKEDFRIDLAKELQTSGSFDVVLFTHAHDDHVKGAKDFFYLEHAKKYQSEDRVKIDELWISAAFILDTDLNSEDAKIIRNEARYRLKNKKGIRVFAEPEKLEDWLSKNDMTKEDVSDCVVHAGQLIANHKLGEEIEFFVHAPFSDDSEEVQDKNDPSIVMQVRLINGSRKTNILITGDTPSTVLNKIVDISKFNKNEDYLVWDLYDVPHHCSYTGLSDDKGDVMTTPTDNVIWLLSQSEENSKIVASCNIIQADSDQPPHLQAKKAYIHYTKERNAEFYATMEYPSKKAPEPLVFNIDKYGLSKFALTTSLPFLKTVAPRAGVE